MASIKSDKKQLSKWFALQLLLLVKKYGVDKVSQALPLASEPYNDSIMCRACEKLIINNLKLILKKGENKI